jgi:glycerophosphoryl diester phosphodiesterase
MIKAFLLFSLIAANLIGVEFIGHRGAPFQVRENTLESFELAFKQNADGVEGDFWLTSDQHIVCAHSPTLLGMDLTETPLAEIKEKAPFIPTLAEVMAIIPAGKKLYIEIKKHPEIVQQIKKLLENSAIKPEQIAVLSFDPGVVQAMRRQLPHIPVYYSVAFDPKKQRPHQRFKAPFELLEQALSLDATGLCMEGYQKDIEAILSLQLELLPWIVWTVDEKPEADTYTQMGAYGIITNDLPGLLN